MEKVANNLVASTLWHRLIALMPPRGLMEDVQRVILDFFWSGRHWVRAAALYLPVAEGGQGLINIQSKIASLRLQAVQRLLYNCGPSWFDTADCCICFIHFPEREMSLYKLPVEKRTVDLQWRVVHGAISTNGYRAHLDPEQWEE